MSAHGGGHPILSWDAWSGRQVGSEDLMGRLLMDDASHSEDVATSEQLPKRAIHLLPVAGLSFPSSLYSSEHAPSSPSENLCHSVGISIQTISKWQTACHWLFFRGCKCTLPNQKAKNQDYFWLEVLHMAAESFTFLLQDCLSCAKPMSDNITSSL